MSWVDPWVGLGWFSQLMGWVGSGHTKWTGVQFHLGNFTDRHLLLDSISAFHACVYPLMYSRVVHELG